MRQKVALAGALVHEPKLIVLDEPFTGLDAGSARQVKTVLREHVTAGGTVIMTTHILEVAERMADRIGVIAGGRLIAQGTLDELRRQAGNGRRSRASRTRSWRWSPTRPPPHERARHPGLVRAPRAAAGLAGLARHDDGGRPQPRPHRWRSCWSVFAARHASRRLLHGGALRRRRRSIRTRPPWSSSPAARSCPGR